MATDFFGRMEMAQTMLWTWINDPFAILFGLGNSSSFHIVGVYPHIVPIEILTEEGFIGFAVYISIVMMAFSSIWWLIRWSGLNRELRDLVANYGAMMLYMFMLSLKQGSAIGSLVMFFFFVACCKLAKLEKRSLPATNPNLKLASV